jgi:hypothetical protein
MTHIELRDSLLTRIGFLNEASSKFAVNTANSTTVSGRYFQDEHPSVTLANVLSTMENNPADAAEFNVYLAQLIKRSIILVLSDVLEVTELPVDFLLDRENILDNAISKRMCIVVGETILTSTRSNSTEAITKQFQQQLFFELNGNEGNPKFPNYVGIKSRYGAEIERLKDALGQEKMLDVITFKTPNYEDIDKIIFP